MKKERNLFLKRPFTSSLSEANLKEKSRKFGNKSSKNKLRILSACLSANDIIPNNLNYRVKSSKNKYNYTINFNSQKFKNKSKSRPQTTTFSSNLFSRSENEDLDYLNLIINSNPNQFNKDMIKKKMEQINDMYIIGTDKNLQRPKLSYKTEEAFYNYNVLYGSMSQNLIRTYSPKMHPLSSSVKVFLKKFNQNMKETIPIFTEDEILLFCKSKCKDLGISFRVNLLYKFKDFCSLRCINRIADLSDCFFGINSIIFLTDILFNSDRISVLNLSRNNIGDEGVELLVKALKNSQSLVSLDISSNSISPKGGNMIFTKFIYQQSIINLDISSHEGVNRNRLTKKGIKNIQNFLKKNLFVEKLNLNSNSLRNEGFELICKGINNNFTLRELSIGNNDIDEEGLKQCLNYINTTKIMSLNLGGNKIKDEGIIIFSNNLRHFPELKSINISNCNIKYKGFKELLNVLQTVTRIEYLDISNNKLQSPKFYELKVFFCAFGIRYLNLSRCNLEDETTYILGECLALNETIKTLILSKNKITDEGFKSFKNLLKNNSSLEYIDLSCNFITELTAKDFISNAEYNNTLKYLNLYDNQIRNDIGKNILKMLDRNKTLTKINLIFNKVQLKTIDEINEKLKKNSKYARKKYVPNIEKNLRDLAFNPKEFTSLTKEIINKKEQRIVIKEKIKEEKKYYKQLAKDEFKSVDKKKLELKEVEKKLKAIDKKISKLNLNMKLVDEDLIINENKIKQEIIKEKREKSEIDILNYKEKAEYELTKKEIEENINKTRIKYGESQDKVINAQKSLSKLELHLKKLNKLYDNLNNPHKISKINKKEGTKTNLNRRKSQFMKKLNELDTNKININLNINNKELNTKITNPVTSSTSPTIHVTKKQKKKKQKFNTNNK